MNIRRLLTAAVLLTGLLVQSCSKKSDVDPGPNPGGGPSETENLKLIPDETFRAYLKAKICPSAFDKTGQYIDITNSEVVNFSGTMTIDTITCPRPFVTSLKGVEYFTKMKKLIVRNTEMDSLSLNETMALDSVKLYNNRDLQYLSVRGCTNMRYLRVWDIPATSLNLSNLPELNYVNLVDLRRMSTLKLDNSPKLQHLMVYGLKSMKNLDVSHNPELARLSLEYCPILTSVDVTHNPKLYNLVLTYGSVKTIDLSKNPLLESVKFDDSAIETIDFSHNPELYSIAMFRTNLKHLSLLKNPKVVCLSLDGCTALQTVDLRAQKSFTFYYADAKYRGMSFDDQYEVLPHGLISPVPTPQHTILGEPTRAGVNGATTNIFAGLRLPQYLDANGLSLTQVKISDAHKDNYSLVMARRTLGAMTPVQITVYASDTTTVLCNDYDPLNYKCN